MGGGDGAVPELADHDVVDRQPDHGDDQHRGRAGDERLVAACPAGQAGAPGVGEGRDGLARDPPHDVLGQVVGLRVAIPGAPGHRLRTDRVEGRGDHRVLGPCAGRLAVDDLGEDVGERLADDRGASREDLEEDGAQAVDVGPFVDQVLPRLDLLGAM
jgi:hypothetical protein